MDLNTILKAIQIVGEATPAAIKLLNGFIPETHGADQQALKDRLVKSRRRSDELHRLVQEA